MIFLLYVGVLKIQIRQGFVVLVVPVYNNLNIILDTSIQIDFSVCTI